MSAASASCTTSPAARWCRPRSRTGRRGGARVDAERLVEVDAPRVRADADRRARAGSLLRRAAARRWRATPPARARSCSSRRPDPGTTRDVVRRDLERRRSPGGGAPRGLFARARGSGRRDSAPTTFPSWSAARATVPATPGRGASTPPPSTRVHRVERAEVAEAAKLFESVFRAVNIALRQRGQAGLRRPGLDASGRCSTRPRTKPVRRSGSSPPARASEGTASRRPVLPVVGSRAPARRGDARWSRASRREQRGLSRRRVLRGARSRTVADRSRTSTPPAGTSSVSYDPGRRPRSPRRGVAALDRASTCATPVAGWSLVGPDVSAGTASVRRARGETRKGPTPSCSRRTSPGSTTT